MGNVKKKEKKQQNVDSDELKALLELQLKGIEQAEEVLITITQIGMRVIDFEFLETISYEIELLVDYRVPGLLKDLRYLHHLLYDAEEPDKENEIMELLGSLSDLVIEAKKYMQFRIAGMEPDVDSVIDTRIGYLWTNKNLLKYGLYEDNAEIIQLSFNSVHKEDRREHYDIAYWFNLKTGKIHYTRKIRPNEAVRFIKQDNTEFDVLHVEKLLTYPGQTNNRIRWQPQLQRKTATSEHFATILQYAESDYEEITQKIKKSFADYLVDRRPVFLVKLHKSFINGDNLVLEDEQGNYLTLLSEEGNSSTELLRAILPSHPVNCALLVQLNDDMYTELFSVTPLTLITSEKIIRLLY